MSDCGFDVGFKAVLARVDDVPERAGLLTGERDADDRLAALEAVLPWQDEAHRGTVLFGERFAVDAGREERQFVGGFGDGQSFRVRPREGTVGHVGSFGWALEGVELDELGFGGWLDHFDQLRQRKAGPRDAHRPRLNAAMAVGALFEIELGVKVVETEGHRFGTESIDRDLPWRRLEVFDIEVRLLARRELIEVRVDRGGLLVGLIATVLEGGVPLRRVMALGRFRDVHLSSRLELLLIRFVFAATGKRSTEQQARCAEAQRTATE